MQEYKRLHTEKEKQIKSLQAENDKQKEQIVTKHAENKKLKQRLQAFETIQSIKTKHYSEWNSDTFLIWIMSLNNGKFKKYEKKLQTTFVEQGVDGQAIQFLKESHWAEF